MTTFTKTLTTFTTASLIAAGAHAATVSSTGDGDILDPATWGGSLPGAADTAVIADKVSTDRTTNSSQTFNVATLQIGDGAGNNEQLELENGSNTLTVNDVILNNNGAIFNDNDKPTLTGDTFTIQGDGGLFRTSRKTNITINFENYAGTGTAYVFGNNSSQSKALTFATTNANPGLAWQNFTGTIHIDVLNGDGGGTGWNHDIDVATFNLIIGDTDTDLAPTVSNGAASNGANAGLGGSDNTLGKNGKLRLDNGVDIKVLSLQLLDQGNVEFDPINNPNELQTTDVLNVFLAPGVYTLDTGANPGAIDLANVNGNDYSRFFLGGSGTVEVVPEPGSLALLGLGAMFVAGRRRRG